MDLSEDLEFDIKIEFSLYASRSNGAPDVPNLPHDVEKPKRINHQSKEQNRAPVSEHILSEVLGEIMQAIDAFCSLGSLTCRRICCSFLQVSKSMILARSCGIFDAAREGCVMCHKVP